MALETKEEKKEQLKGLFELIRKIRANQLKHFEEIGALYEGTEFLIGDLIETV